MRGPRVGAPSTHWALAAQRTAFAGCVYRPSLACNAPKSRRGCAVVVSLELDADQAVKTDRFKPQAVAARVAEIRKRACREHLGGGLLYLESGPQILRNGSDVFFPYRADSNFVYMTGVNQPDFACLIDTESGSLTLLAPKLPPEASFWMGGLPSLEELAEQYGADNCTYSEDLKHLLLHSPTFRGKPIHTTAALEPRLTNLLGQPPSPPQPGPDAGQAVPPGPAGGGTAFLHQGGTSRVIGGLLESTLARCRAVKTEGEVACLLQASHASGKGHMDMWRACRPGMYEFQLEAVFRHSTMMQGCHQLGYPCIVGAGRNSAILHYETNQARAASGDLVLVDAGAEVECYTADISRTFPVSGTFSLAQRELYNAVLAAQEHALQAMRGGCFMSDMEAGSRRVLLSHLRDMGLVKGDIEGMLNKKIDRVFMPHGLGHFLGLDVHDVSAAGPVPKTLQAGHVVTVEPGLYFIEPLIQSAAANAETAAYLVPDKIEAFKDMGGVRIEDNVLVEDDGVFNLTTTAGVVKTVQDIERIMQG